MVGNIMYQHCIGIHFEEAKRAGGSASLSWCGVYYISDSFAAAPPREGMLANQKFK